MVHPLILQVGLVGFLLGAGTVASQAPTVGLPAPDFRLSTLAGESTRLSDLRGRPVLLNFWASWCEPCRSEMPAIAEARTVHRHTGLEVLAVNLRDQERGRDVQRFVEESGLSFPILLDAKGKVRRLYRIRAVPATIFVDSSGIVRFIHAGPLTTPALARGLFEILGPP